MKSLETSKRLRTFQNFVQTTASILSFARNPNMDEFTFTAIIQEMWLSCAEETDIYDRHVFVQKVIFELKETFKGNLQYSEHFSMSDLYTEGAI